MSPVHGTQGQQFARPAQQPQNQWGQPTQPQNGSAQTGYQNPGPYAQQPYPAQIPYAAPQDDYGYPGAQSAPAQPHAAQGYAPQFEPYVPTQPRQAYAANQLPQPSAPTYAQQQVAYGAAPTYAPANAGQYNHASQHPQHAQNNWGQAPDSRGFDLGTYLPAQQPGLPAVERAPAQTDWGLGGYQAEADGYAPEVQEHGFAQAAGGELDQGYAEDEAQEYELEDPPRGRRPMMMVAVLAGAIMIGGGLTYAYKSILGGAAGGDPPVVKSAEAPSKVKPEDGGGKQFSHTDSKIMGRLGDGNGAAAPAAGDADPSGTRKVATLVVGRDGSIQAPAAAPAAPAAPQAANDAMMVPGMTVVDGLGPSRAPAAAATMASVNTPPPSKAEAPAPAAAPAAPAPAAPAKIVVSPSAAPAPQKPVTIAKAPAPAAPTQDSTASIEPAAPATAPAKAVKKVAKAPAAPTSNSVATTGNGANGFVAVLASVPRTDSSRMDALKRFADMQQKYAAVLAGKTPDVAEANLGTKGNYHRLVVGPPGSREQASNVCTQLKSQGYADCWVTSY